MKEHKCSNPFASTNDFKNLAQKNTSPGLAPGLDLKLKSAGMNFKNPDIKRKVPLYQRNFCLLPD